MDKTISRKETSCHTREIPCSECTIGSICFPFVLAGSDIVHLNNLATLLPTFKEGKMIIRAGDPASSIYVVRSGSVKSFCISEDGEEQIMAFHFPGEVVGLESANQPHYMNYVTTLETTSVCSLSMKQLEQLARNIPALQAQLIKLMSRELLQEQELIMLLNRKDTQSRLASFIVNLAARYRKRGLSSTRFHLPMSRAEIANYLGMAGETVSRIMSSFREKGIVQVQRNELQVLNIEALTEIAGTKCKLASVG